MSYAKTIRVALLVGLAACIVWLAVVYGADAKGYESVGVKEAHTKVLAAKRAVTRAQARLSKARAVEAATRAGVAQYGVNVGRWVWLASDVGWPRSTWGHLLYIINRESGGSPKALNASSGAAGLLQFMPQWYRGEWGYPALDPYIPRSNLKAGIWVYKREGWQPWAL